MKDSQGTEFEIGAVLVSSKARSFRIQCVAINEGVAEFLRIGNQRDEPIRLSQGGLSTSNWVKEK